LAAPRPLNGKAFGRHGHALADARERIFATSPYGTAFWILFEALL
jgi:hypothetical protein